MRISRLPRRALGALGHVALHHALPELLATSDDPLETLRFVNRPAQRIYPREFSDADPFKLIRIDPNEIAYVSNAGKRWLYLPGEVMAGDWDRHGQPVEEDVVFRTIADHIHDGVPLEVEPYRQYYLAHTKGRNQRGWGVTFQQQCDRVYRLIERIERGGYRSQRELLDTVGVDRLQRENNDTIHPLLNEIRVDTDRYGRFHFWRCGSHRLAIARALELPVVPALVGTRHSGWQQVRDEIRRGAAPESLGPGVRGYRGHPDLQDLTGVDHPAFPVSRPGREYGWWEEEQSISLAHNGGERPESPPRQS